MSSAVPHLSDDQRRRAREIALAARASRARTKDELRSGTVTLGEVCDRAQHDDALAQLRVRDLLQCLPRVGEKRAEEIMQRHQIAANRRLRGLGRHQQQRLVAEFDR